MNVSATVQDILRQKNPQTRIAVIGASNDEKKYGNIITRNLLKKGYTVLPVHPQETTIAGLPVFADVRAVPTPVHIACFVTPPAVTLKMLEQCLPPKVEHVWFQDGSFDDAVLLRAAELKMSATHHACIMVLSNY